jgi:hypothetical protein
MTGGNRSPGGRKLFAGGASPATRALETGIVGSYWDEPISKVEPRQDMSDI